MNYTSNLLIYAVCDDVHQMQSDETDAEISIGTEIPDHEPIDDLQTQDDLPSSLCKEEGVFAGSSEFQADNYDHGKPQYLFITFMSLNGFFFFSFLFDTLI